MCSAQIKNTLLVVHDALAVGERALKKATTKNRHQRAQHTIYSSACKELF